MSMVYLPINLPLQKKIPVRRHVIRHGIVRNPSHKKVPKSDVEIRILQFSLQSKGTSPMPPPPRNKGLIRPY